MALALFMGTGMARCQIFTVDYINGTIGEYNLSGGVINSNLVTTASSYPNTMTEANGVLYVGTGSAVEAYTTSGATVSTSLISVPNMLPISLDVAPNGNLYVLDYSNLKLRVYTTSGAVVNSSLISFSGTPTAMTVDASGNVYVTDYYAGTVSLYNSSGTLVNSSLVTGLVHPYGVAINSGNLYVSSTGSSSSASGFIGEYSLGGTAINASLVTGLAEPYGMAFDNGDLFVANRGLYVGGGSIGEYNATTGAPVQSTLISGGTPNSIIVLEVPEPATWVLMACGFAGLMGVGLCRRLTV